MVFFSLHSCFTFSLLCSTHLIPSYFLFHASLAFLFPPLFHLSFLLSLPFLPSPSSFLFPSSIHPFSIWLAFNSTSIIPLLSPGLSSILSSFYSIPILYLVYSLFLSLTYILFVLYYFIQFLYYIYSLLIYPCLSLLSCPSSLSYVFLTIVPYFLSHLSLTIL